MKIKTLPMNHPKGQTNNPGLKPNSRSVRALILAKTIPLISFSGLVLILVGCGDGSHIEKTIHEGNPIACPCKNRDVCDDWDGWETATKTCLR